MFFRHIIGELRAWVACDRRKPFVIRGAWQVGKTTAVDLFARDFDQYIYLNLEHEAEADVFRHRLSPDDLIQSIFLMKRASLSQGATLIFIDEIQQSPEAVAMMRYFYESAPDLPVIAAGSLLEAMMGRQQISFPVGRVRYLFMYPMTFAEFLQASNEDQAYELYQQTPLPDFARSKLMKCFHTYTLIGGMPEVVGAYLDTRDLVALAPVYQSLISAYLDDVSKYARNETMVEVIRHAIESTPFEAGRRIKFHGFGRSNYRSREMGEALRILERAMLLYLCYPTTATHPPVVPDKRKAPVLQFLDTGLLNYIIGLQTQFFQHQDLEAFYHGLLAEHIVRQELLALDAHTHRKPALWVREKKQSTAEVDVLIAHNGYSIPVEIKAGKTGTLRSLHQFMDRVDHPYAVRLYAGPLEITPVTTPSGKACSLLNLPYCLAGRLPYYLDWFIGNQ